MSTTTSPQASGVWPSQDWARAGRVVDLYGHENLVLDRAFGNYQLDSQRESMRLQQLLLAKAADWDGMQWVFTGLDELRLNLLRSGLYAFVLGDGGEMLWRSPSSDSANPSCCRRRSIRR